MQTKQLNQLIDDAKVNIVQEVPAVSPNDISTPVLIPYPWQANITGNNFELSNIAIIDEISNEAVNKALESFCESMELEYEFLSSNDARIEYYLSRLIIGNDENILLFF